jgi:hypothetical protein
MTYLITLDVHWYALHTTVLKLQSSVFLEIPKLYMGHDRVYWNDEGHKFFIFLIGLHRAAPKNSKPKPIYLTFFKQHYLLISKLDRCHFNEGCDIILIHAMLTPKGRSPFFGPFLEFGQAIVDAIFVQKISNFWWTCGLVVASRCTDFYKIPKINYIVSKVFCKEFWILNFESWHFLSCLAGHH